MIFLDFDNDSYAQNSEIIQKIRIQKNFFKIPIGIFFLKKLTIFHHWLIPQLQQSIPQMLDSMQTMYNVYHNCGIVYHKCRIVYLICGILYHLRYTKKIKFLNFWHRNICENPNFIFFCIPQMWYSIPHMWYTQKLFFGFWQWFLCPKFRNYSKIKNPKELHIWGILYHICGILYHKGEFPGNPYTVYPTLMILYVVFCISHSIL